MENKVISVGILVVNIAVVIVFFYLFCYVVYKCFKIPSYDKDHKFFSFKLGTTSVLFILNIIALYVNYQFFFVHHYEVSGGLMWLRYTDRICMGIYAWFKVLEIYKFAPSAYDRLIM